RVTCRCGAWAAENSVPKKKKKNKKGEASGTGRIFEIWQDSGRRGLRASYRTKENRRNPARERGRPVMSFFGGGAAAKAQQQQALQQQAMEQEIEMLSDMYNRMVSSCHRKCIPVTYRDGELTKGESVCIDRCTAKFFDVNKLVGEQLQQMSAAAQNAAGAVVQ
ncbi:MAG: Tim10/DDP family zinc finger-domain-containing protein, partial [Olpidium bornovanus]